MSAQTATKEESLMHDNFGLLALERWEDRSVVLTLERWEDRWLVLVLERLDDH